MMGFDEPLRAVIVGARSGVGGGLVAAIREAGPHNQVWATTTSGSGAPDCSSRCSAVDITQEGSIQAFTDELDEHGFVPNLVVNCTGILHTDEFGPERTWRRLNLDVMRRVFEVNAFGPALLGKHLIPRFSRTQRSVFASLSARVGSIGDNRLGGWYSYRASKSAQNMLIKTLAIEAKMKWPELVCVALHPGTVDTELSRPFTSRVPAEKLFTPRKAAQHLSEVIASLTPSDSGGFFAWDGQPIEF